MFEKLRDKLKASKLPKLSFTNSFLNTNNLAYRLSPKQFRFLNGNLTSKFVQMRAVLSSQINKQILNLPFYTALKSIGHLLTKQINKRTIAGSFAGSLAFYLFYIYNPLATRVSLFYENTDFNNKLIPSLSYLYKSYFYPSLFATSALQQSIMNNQIIEAKVRYDREPLLLPDGGQITLDWTLPTKCIEYTGSPVFGQYYPYQPSKNNKIMFVIHGLNGGSEANYIQALVSAASKKGYRVVVMNQRGINQALTTPMPFHGGHHRDVEFAIRHIKKVYPNAPLLAVGTSYGGNQLLRYLGENGHHNDFEAAVLLSAPFDLEACLSAVENSVYEEFFVKTYFEKALLPHIDIYQSLADSHGINIEEILKVKSVRDYHTLFTIKLFDYKDLRDYFSLSKITDSHIKNVKVPTLVMHSKDDPIAVRNPNAASAFAQNPNIVYAETNRGAHLCWFSGFRPRRWYCNPTIEFLDKVLELKQGKQKEHAANSR